MSDVRAAPCMLAESDLARALSGAAGHEVHPGPARASRARRTMLDGYSHQPEPSPRRHLHRRRRVRRLTLGWDTSATATRHLSPHLSGAPQPWPRRHGRVVRVSWPQGCRGRADREPGRLSPDADARPRRCPAAAGCAGCPRRAPAPPPGPASGHACTAGAGSRPGPRRSPARRAGLAAAAALPPRCALTPARCARRPAGGSSAARRPAAARRATDRAARRCGPSPVPPPGPPAAARSARTAPPPAPGAAPPAPARTALSPRQAERLPVRLRRPAVPAQVRRRQQRQRPAAQMAQHPLPVVDDQQLPHRREQRRPVRRNRTRAGAAPGALVATRGAPPTLRAFQPEPRPASVTTKDPCPSPARIAT